MGTGNAGTWKYRRGADEHGCEFVPVAGPDKICLEILSAPCSYDTALVLAGLPGYFLLSKNK